MSQASEQRPRLATKVGSSFRNFFAWYKSAVLSPVTESEKAEWQKTSF
ncbi:hypothetical protein [Granulicella arctica]|uniref:Uncharacterized protein n=1 Tax=Granulicella arctica TaxID=940613 RepID=A0A7Y9THF4_9BACT|nr:hypothetical protein [Granulicella arctica]NYF80469.1 hypothetical protein [Granulicella arctica]